MIGLLTFLRMGVELRRHFRLSRFGFFQMSLRLVGWLWMTLLLGKHPSYCLLFLLELFSQLSHVILKKTYSLKVEIVLVCIIVG
jgi:hypothetical protein